MREWRTTSASDLTASRPGSSGASPTAAKALRIKDFAFNPGTSTVKAGASLTVTNDDSQPHTVTSDATGAFDTGTIAAGAAATRPLRVPPPGTYPFHCSFHPFMHGTLVVTQ